VRRIEGPSWMDRYPGGRRLRLGEIDRAVVEKELVDLIEFALAKRT